MCLNQVKPSTECSFCTFLIKTLEGLLPKERTEVKHGYTAHKNSTSLCCTQTLKSNQTTQLRVITARVFFFFLTLLLFYRKQWSSCWKRSAIFCRPPTATSVRLWSTRSAGQCWMQYWLMRPRRPSVTSCTSVKGKNLCLWVSLFSLASIAVIVIVYLICHMLDTKSPETRMSNNLSCTCFIFKKKSLSADLIWHNYTLVTTASFMHYSTF